jgi:fructose-1,6-bisphosphatase/inositol monophosphatase family enzyme
VLAEQGRGAFLLEGCQETRVGDMVRTTVSPISELREATVLFGMDVPTCPELSHFLLDVANQAQTCAMGGSCALGVAAVVAGRAEALIQTRQWPWDWVSAWMIQEAGGKVIWFHYREGKLVQLAAPDQASYSRLDRRQQGGLGFIAGNPQVVNQLWHLLQCWWPRSWPPP